MSSQSNPVNPTFEGYVASTDDAFILFGACLSGQLNHVPRRLYSWERKDLVKSGYVFIYEEHSSGIERWTDDVHCGPCHVLGNFRVHREQCQQNPQEENEQVFEDEKSHMRGIKTAGNIPRSSMEGSTSFAVNRETNATIFGSSIDSYPVKTNGLVKTTISMSFQGITHHLVSYYYNYDVMSGRLRTPTKHTLLRDITPRTELIRSQTFGNSTGEWQ